MPAMHIRRMVRTWMSCLSLYVTVTSSHCAAQGAYSTAVYSEANHSQRSTSGDVHHWLTSEKFIRNYRSCRFENWSYKTLPLCLKYDTTGVFNSSTWHRRYPSCGGSQQSPIMVLFAQSEYKYFDPIQFFNYDSYLQLDIEMVGTTLFFYPFGLDLGVFGGPLQVQYSFFMGTIHFGKGRDSGSEHLIEKQGYAAEVQLIHSTELTSDNDCLKEANGLLVLVILFELEEMRKLHWRLGGDSSCTGLLAGNVRPIADEGGFAKSTRTVFRSFFSYASSSPSTTAPWPTVAALAAVVAAAGSPRPQRWPRFV
ncbi:uncharacterized protein [Dermacentor albipictus]|uniref:uncharacterized protein isoform X2 n=1 Tax=Dermacentor albipictus TaxID=60249 RepID=UPI0038FC4740